MATAPPREGSQVPWSCAIRASEMDTRLFILASAALVSALGGCTKTAPPPPEDDVPCTVASADSVGVAECDTYLCKSQACLERSKRSPSQVKAIIKAERDSFRIAAGTREGKAGAVKEMCVAKLAQLATSPACSK